MSWFDIYFEHTERVHALWGVVALVALLAWLEQRGQDRLDRFVSQAMAGRLAARLPRAIRRLRLGLIGLCLAFGVLALMQPRSRSQTEAISADSMSADVMVVLDVSRSMLAVDAAPSRLERAKTEIAELVSAMRRHRFGLIAFAGRAAFLCPLTTDHAYFRMVLDGVSPKSVTRGGTRIGEALTAAVDGFGPGSGARLIVLITDGEDQDSFPLDAADKARDQGIRVVTIGFGDEEHGSPIMVPDDKTGGAYVPAGTSGLDLESIVSEHIEPIARAGAVAQDRRVPLERYPIFVMLALLALLGAVAVGGATSLEVVR